MSEDDIEAQRSLADLSICDKRVLVAQLVQEEAARSKMIHPQSYNQRAMWFLWQMAPESPAYIVAIAARVGSVVDVDALRRALQSLIDRHPALRTTLAQSQEGAVQCVADFQEVAFEQIQATDLDEAGLRAKVRAAANRPFDLEAGPVFRASLFSRRADDHVLLIAVHHIAFDGWSSLLFWRELRVACSAETAGKTFSLPAPTARYIDYVHWQRQLLEGEEGRRLWAYWQQELAGDLPALNLPTDRPRPPVQTLSGASRIFTLGPDLTARLRSLSQEEGTTLYTVLLAAFQVLLSLYSGQRDILVGSPVAGRRRVEFARVVGDFVNTVVIRGRCSQGLTFRQFLAQVRRKVLAALEHQDFPFALLVERLNLKRDPSRSPLFQVAFDLQQLRRYGDLAPFVLPHASEVEVAFGALVMKPYFFPQQEGQFDLSLQVFEDSETILGVFKYSTDLFEESTIQRMQRDFEALLERMTSDPETAISDQSLVVGQMGLATFLSHLRKLDIKLWADGDRLRVNAPSGALTPALQSEIGRHKTDILALLKGVQDAANTAAPALRPVSRQGPLELSFAQQRLWFLDQLGSGSSVYNIPVALRASGALDLPVLQRSLDEVLRRHEALRTRFLASSGQAFQVIEPPGPVELSTLDLRGLPAAEREAAAVRQVREVSTRPFDLGRGPFLRATVLRLGEEEHILVVTTHHIAADGWSLGVLGREMRILYEAFLNGHPSPLPDLPIQYADFAHWQRQWLQGARLQQQLAYWKQKLVGPLPALDLLTDHPRPAVPSSRGARLLFILCPEVVGRLKDFSNREGVTLFMTLLAAFKVLLHRYTRQEDILVGSPVAGRSQPETEGLIGFFLNNLVLRTDLSGDPTFRQLLGRVRSVALEAYANQDVPFEKLVEVLQPERDTGRLPLFQVLFSLQNVPLEEARLAGTSLRPFEFDIGTSRYDLTFELWERPEGLRVYVEYNTDLFEEATVRRMFGHYTTLLDAVLVHPECRISGLPLLDEAERRQLLGEWNATQAPFPETGIHQLFETQAIRTPEAVAVTCEDAEIRYGELNRRANQLARHLKTLGVSPETLVGVYMERSIEMVVALLGTLKAGGAYLPLDPAFPADRLAFMIEDSGAGALLTQARLVGQLPADGVKTVYIDADWPAIAAQGGENLDDADAPENTAYVLYTSGSTGRPKGVQVLHRGLVNFLTSVRREPGLAPEDILLSVTTLSFDIAGLEIFLPLTSGARVVLVSAAVAADGPRLLRVLQNSGTTVMQATPATWRLLLSAGWQGTPGLKILCGGEAMSAELAAQLLPRGASALEHVRPHRDHHLVHRLPGEIS